MKITLKNLLGKIMLVGITYYSHDDQLIERQQYWGKVISSDEDGVVILQQNGETLTLPSDLSSTQKAKKGVYHLHSTGEDVVNPDFLATWNVKLPPDDEE